MKNVSVTLVKFSLKSKIDFKITQHPIIKSPKVFQ